MKHIKPITKKLKKEINNFEQKNDLKKRKKLAKLCLIINNLNPHF
jgi:hypothetical protein